MRADADAARGWARRALIALALLFPAPRAAGDGIEADCCLDAPRACEGPFSVDEASASDACRGASALRAAPPAPSRWRTAL